MKQPFKIFLFLGLVILCVGCARPPSDELERYSETREMMGTFIRLDICLDSPSLKVKEAYKDVWQRLDDIAWRMNIYDKKSDVAQIHRAYPKAAVVGQDTYQLIEDAIAYNQLTLGAFDVTVWPLITLWKEAEEKGKVPDKLKIQKIKEAVGSNNVELLDGLQVRTKNMLTQIDLGGIAKGYALDEAARIFRSHQINNFYIDAGGDVYVGGHNCEGSPWRIGIRDPRDRSKIIDVLHVKNLAVTTSGNYEQYYNIDNQRWSHIINTITGYPQSGVVSATVVASSGKEADALSTALCVLGKNRAKVFMDSLADPLGYMVLSFDEEERMQRHYNRKYESYRRAE